MSTYLYKALEYVYKQESRNGLYRAVTTNLQKPFITLIYYCDLKIDIQVFALTG